MDSLASNDDVAHSLGLADATALSVAQAARIPALMAKLCGQFRREAVCEFTPGTTDIKLLSVDGRITLPDILNGVILDQDGDVIAQNPGSVNSVLKWEDGCAVSSYTVVGQDVIPREEQCYGPRRVGTGDAFQVNYTHNGAVPDDVSAAVAACVSRYLAVDPKSAVAQSTFLSAEGYHQRMAAWVAQSVWLDAADVQLARSYRALPSMPVVAKLGHRTHRDFNTEFSINAGTAW
jgi:hypothetical protein